MRFYKSINTYNKLCGNKLSYTRCSEMFKVFLKSLEMILLYTAYTAIGLRAQQPWLIVGTVSQKD